MSLVGYRINSSATTLGNKMERLGAGLVWNGVSPSNLPNNAGHASGQPWIRGTLRNMPPIARSTSSDQMFFGLNIITC